jgi:mono/diheme cytochrome c family protein
VALLLVAVAVTFAVAAGCGGGGSTPESTQAPPPPASVGESGATIGTADSSAAPASDGSGARVFEQRCVLCHGKTGLGDGAAAAGLNPKPRNLRDATYMDARTDEQLLDIIRNGKGAMPAWGKNNTLSEEEIQAVLRHIRGFTHPS